jgi:hypothetical protein
MTSACPSSEAGLPNQSNRLVQIPVALRLVDMAAARGSGRL